MATWQKVSTNIGIAGSDLASAANLTIPNTGDYFKVTGTTGIGALTIEKDRRVTLEFAGACNLTSDAAFDIGDEDFTTATGDILTFQATAANTVKLVSYSLYSQEAISVPGASLDTEGVQDIVGAMVSGNTETGISVIYQDSNGTIDFVNTTATTSVKGIARFSSNNFAVSGGLVYVKAGGIDNDELAGSIQNDKLLNSSIEIAGTSTALGASLGAATLVESLESEAWDFTGGVTITGDLTVSGTTTTVQTQNVIVEDKNIILGKPDTDYGDDGLAETGSDGGGISLWTDASGTGAEANFANFTWNKNVNSVAHKLTGWCVEDTQAAGKFEVAVMEYSSNSTAPGNSDNAAGVGSFHYDTGDDSLYIRTE